MNKGLDLVSTSWIVAVALALAGTLDSKNLVLWTIISVSLPLAVIAIGGRRTPAIMLLNLGLFWASIYCSLLSISVSEISEELTSDQYRAIIYSLVAMLFLAIGFRAGFKPSDASIRRTVSTRTIDVHKAFAGYVFAIIFNIVLSAAGAVFPALVQPMLAFTALKWVALYILCFECLRQRRMHIYIFIALAFELATGASGYIATYQPAFLTVIAATLNWAGGRFSPTKLFAATSMLLLFFGVSVIWTAIKPEFRTWMAEASSAQSGSVFERLGWIGERVTREIDYEEAAIKLADRIGYTRLYAFAMPRLDAPEAQRSIYLLGAIEEVAMPRALFPNKPILDDTKITMELTGVQFSAVTSVSIGYVAQAHADFGVPGMFVEIFLIGWALALFSSRVAKAGVTLVGQQALITAALAYKFFYQSNIDKALSTFILQAIALSLFSKFGYRAYEKWLTQPLRYQADNRKGLNSYTDL